MKTFNENLKKEDIQFESINEIVTAILLNQENFTFIAKSDLMKAYRQSKNNADSFHLIGV